MKLPEYKEALAEVICKQQAVAEANHDIDKALKDTGPDYLKLHHWAKSKLLEVITEKKHFLKDEDLGSERRRFLIHLGQVRLEILELLNSKDSPNGNPYLEELLSDMMRVAKLTEVEENSLPKFKALKNKKDNEDTPEESKPKFKSITEEIPLAIPRTGKPPAPPSAKQPGDHERVIELRRAQSLQDAKRGMDRVRLIREGQIQEAKDLAESNAQPPRNEEINLNWKAGQPVRTEADNRALTLKLYKEGKISPSEKDMRIFQKYGLI